MSGRDLLAAATPRPWRAGAPGSHALHPGAVVLADGFAEGSVFVAECAWDATAYRDADLIVAAVNEYEALLDIAEIVKARRARFAEERPGDHPRNAEEKALDAALTRLDALRSVPA